MGVNLPSTLMEDLVAMEKPALNVLHCLCVWSASLVPVFSFGENDLFHQIDNPDGSALRHFQVSFKKLVGFSPPVFYGPGICNCFLPFRKPLHTIG